MLTIKRADLRRVDQDQGQIQSRKLNIGDPGLQREENLDPVQNQQ